MNNFKQFNFEHGNVRSICNVFCALISAYFFVFFIPWEIIKSREFTDVINYVSRMEVLSRQNEDIQVNIQLLTSEWLWGGILKLVTVFTYDFRYGLFLLSYVSLSIYLYYASKELPIFLVVVFLFNPMFIDLILSQVRIALAFSLLIIAWYSKSNLTKCIFVLSSFFIHSASFLIVFVFLFIYYLVRSLGYRRSVYFSVILFSLLTSLFLDYGLSLLLSFIGDRRAEFSNMGVGSSILYSSFWFLLTILLSIKSPINKSNIYVVSFSISMMSIFFFNSLFGVYGQRFVAISLLPIFMSVTYLPFIYRFLSFSLLLIYQTFQWIYWIDVSLL